MFLDKEGFPLPTLSIVIPIYNERDTWQKLVQRVEAVDLGAVKRQLVLVDDCSSDGTRAQLEEFAASRPDAVVKFHPVNAGKGAALRTGFASATGDFVIDQDADLEYDPADYPALLEPLLAGQADVVFGSRFLVKPKEKGYAQNYLANKILTWLSNLTTGLHLTDMETCYKVFRREVLGRLKLEQDRFGFEPEVTAKLAALGVRIVERPIRYAPRTVAEGKKIKLKDGFNAIKCIWKYRPKKKS
jgi:glycosyltransferase involved in cell wall biosynthesis